MYFKNFSPDNMISRCRGHLLDESNWWLLLKVYLFLIDQNACQRVASNIRKEESRRKTTYERDSLIDDVVLRPRSPHKKEDHIDEDVDYTRNDWAPLSWREGILPSKESSTTLWSSRPTWRFSSSRQKCI